MKRKDFSEAIKNCNSPEVYKLLCQMLPDYKFYSRYEELKTALEEKRKLFSSNANDINSSIEVGENVEVNLDCKKELSTNDNYFLFEQALDSLLKYNLTSMLVSGQGGTGKSYTVLQKLNNTTIKTVDGDCYLEEGKDFEIVKGHTSPRGLYEKLWDCRENKIIVFDDCDSILADRTSVNILKAALDSSVSRTISWISSREASTIPNSFDFKSKVIFLTNLPKEKLDPALLTRCVFFNLYLSPKQLCERARELKGTLLSCLDEDLKEKILTFVEQHCYEINNFSLRTYLKINQLVRNDMLDIIWKNYILHIV